MFAKKYLHLLPDFWIIPLFLLTVPLFLYKLGQSSLGSWDEAWYADLARHIARTGDLFNLVYNGQPFTDHPPLGFWLMAISFKFLGINEFSARLVSALAGLMALILTYLLGKQLFNRWVGLASALGLLSAPWFLYRARSGNLDTLLTLLFVLTFYLALRVIKNRYFLAPFAISLALLFLSKAALPFTIIPALIILFWKSSLKTKDFFMIFILSISLFGLWITSQLFKDPTLVLWYISHGERGVSLQGGNRTNLIRMITYLHSGIGRWYWMGVSGLILGALLRRRKLFAMIVLIVCYFTPFVFSTAGQIWHLVPLYPFLILLFLGSFDSLLRTTKFEKITPVIILFLSLYISLMQIKSSWHQFIDIPAYVSDEAILSKEANKYPDKYYIDGDFDPAATFYSDKVVQKVSFNGLNDLFSKKEPFLLFTSQSNLNQVTDKYGYQVLKKDRDKVLVRKL